MVWAMLNLFNLAGYPIICMHHDHFYAVLIPTPSPQSRLQPIFDPNQQMMHNKKIFKAVVYIISLIM